MNKHVYAGAVVLALCLSAALAGCGNEQQAAEKPLLVRTETVGTKSGATAADYAGVVKGRYESNLSFQVSGRITSRNVQLGSVVHSGEVLMTVDPKDVQQGVNQAAAVTAAAQAQYDLAASNLARYQALYTQNAVSAAQLDQYQTAYDQAAAQYRQAAAQAQSQQNQLSYTALTADADGVIAAVSGEVGQVAAAGQPVLTLVHSGDLEVEIHVPENHVDDFRAGKEVTVSFWALQQQSAQGIVREVAPMADNVTRTYTVTVSLPSPPPGMRLGMTATVTAKGETPDTTAYVLPLSAIYQTGNTPYVWVVTKDHAATLKKVTIVSFGDDNVQVTGLAAGDVVITAGVHLLQEGQPVRLEGDEG